MNQPPRKVSIPLEKFIAEEMITKKGVVTIECNREKEEDEINAILKAKLNEFTSVPERDGGDK